MVADSSLTTVHWMADSKQSKEGSGQAKSALKVTPSDLVFQTRPLLLPFPPPSKDLFQPDCSHGLNH